MAGTLWKLFRKSPFGPIQEHMKKVVEAAHLMAPLMEHLIADEQEAVLAMAKQVSRVEGEADDIKKDIRAHLPKSLFMPVDRGDLLRQLSAQDSIADAAEDVGVLLTLRKMSPPPWMHECLKDYVAAVLKTVDQSGAVVAELDVLVEASFGGPEADRVIEMVDALHLAEHEADKLQDQIAKLVFQHEDDMKPVAVFMWSKIFNKLGDLANHAENVGDRIRLFVSEA